MNDHCDRSSFVKTAAAAGAAWALGQQCSAAHALDVKARPMDQVRIGLVGLGSRGSWLLSLLLDLEGVAIKAVCDIIPERVAKAQDMVAAARQPRPNGYSRGETDFRRLCETEELDLVINATRPWKWHVPISVAAMAAGKHAATSDKIYIEGRSPKVDTWEPMEAYYKEFEHPLWKALGQKAASRGGHGGGDWLELHRLVRALLNGTPPDMDVYDAAAWSCITELSEKSVATRSSPMDFPDFTRGRWKTTPPIGIIGL